MRKYPLDALEAVRAARAETEVGRLGQEQQRAAAARSELARADAELERARESLKRADALSRRWLEDGQARAADLALAADEQRAELARVSASGERRASAEAALARAEALRARAARAYEMARAELTAVERHREDWARGEERRADERADEAALERWNGERSGSSGR